MPDDSEELPTDVTDDILLAVTSAASTSDASDYLTILELTDASPE